MNKKITDCIINNKLISDGNSMATEIITYEIDSTSDIINGCDNIGTLNHNDKITYIEEYKYNALNEFSPCFNPSKTLSQSRIMVNDVVTNAKAYDIIFERGYDLMFKNVELIKRTISYKLNLETNIQNIIVTKANLTTELIYKNGKLIHYNSSIGDMWNDNMKFPCPFNPNDVWYGLDYIIK